jgi:glyoxylase-like metal-dependent hydrolase (beta-lactamase superfamily II)
MILRPTLMAMAATCGILGTTPCNAQTPAGSAGTPYRDMPELASIGVRPDRYLPVPESAKAPPIDPAKGYRIQKLGRDLYLVTDNAYQSMFMVYETGVVVVDAPPGYAKHIRAAIAEVTDRPITHVIYSHSHTDHIGGVNALGSHPIVIAQDETARLLARAKDPERPLPTVTFKDSYTLKVGSQRLELSYHGVAHEPGNIFIYAPEQRVLMVVDVVFPGWMPWRRFALAQDVPGYFAQVAEIDRIPFETFVGGHVERDRRRDGSGRHFKPLGGLRQLYRPRGDPVRQHGDPEMAIQARGLRRLHLGPVLRDGAEPPHRLTPPHNNHLDRSKS